MSLDYMGWKSQFYWSVTLLGTKKHTHLFSNFSVHGYPTLTLASFLPPW